MIEVAKEEVLLRTQEMMWKWCVGPTSNRLQSPTLWIEVCPPKSYSFLVGVLYRPPTVSVNSDKLEKLQRRAARIIMHLGSSEKALNLLGYVTLEKRRESRACNLVKKCLSNRCPQFFMNYFNYNRDIVPRKTRGRNKLRRPTIRLECTKKAFFLS